MLQIVDSTISDLNNTSLKVDPCVLLQVDIYQIPFTPVILFEDVECATKINLITHDIECSYQITLITH